MRYTELVQLLGEGRVTELQVESLDSQTFSYRVVMGECAEVPLFLVTQPPGSTIVGSQVYATSHKTRLGQS